MTLQTRGSAAIDKAQRRLASLKSIDEQLDLGHGLTVDRYDQMIETVRGAIEAHNTLVSQLDASRRQVRALEQELADLTVRMLSGVATKYGKHSTEYRMAGGNPRQSKTRAARPVAARTPEAQLAALERVAASLAD